MARPIAESKVMHHAQPVSVHGDIEYRLADLSDDAELRHLLKENAIEGWVTLSYEREPNYFLATTIEGDVHDAVICVDRKRNKIFGICTRSIQQRYVNGKVTSLGYLGNLRLSSPLRNKLRPLKNGFEFCRQYLHSRQFSPYYLTTIVADNKRAERVLTANLKGFPTYRPLESISTVAMAVCPRPGKVSNASCSVIRAEPVHWDALIDCLNRNNQRYQFASHWTRQDLQSTARSRDLSINDFFLAVKNDRIIGCLACWDQSDFKQLKVRGYRPGLKWARPMINLAAKISHYPRLPSPGQEINLAYLSHVAIDNDDPEVLVALIDKVMQQARVRGISTLMLGYSQRHPLLPMVRQRFRHLIYNSQLYQVYWDDGVESAHAIDNRIIHMDIASL